MTEEEFKELDTGDRSYYCTCGALIDPINPFNSEECTCDSELE